MGGGRGGDGITLALGAFSDRALLRGSSSPSTLTDRTPAELSAGGALVLRTQRSSFRPALLEVWSNGCAARRGGHITERALRLSPWPSHTRARSGILGATPVRPPVNGRSLAGSAVLSFAEGEWATISIRVGRQALHSVHINGSRVLSSLHVSQSRWHADGDWTFGASAATYGLTDMHAVRRVRGHCGVDGQVSLPFTVSAGGWFATAGGGGDTSKVVPFVYYAPPTVSSASPLLGHLAGGGFIQLHGVGLQYGVGQACAFGAAFSPAVYRPDTGALTCHAPAATAPAIVTLHAALNGQQAAPSSLLYEYVDPIVSLVYPASGPSAGGTALLVTGNSALQLRTDLPAARCVLNGTSFVTATWDDVEGALRCNTPAMSSLDVSTTVQ
eukprot:5394343-Prymnesium_polylepis.1